jgi:hypothetical protein
MIRRDEWSFEFAMENLRCKEPGTSATIAEADGLAVRITLQHPTKVVGRGCAFHWLSDALHSHHLDLISDPSDRL